MTDGGKPKKQRREKPGLGTPSKRKAGPSGWFSPVRKYWRGPADKRSRGEVALGVVAVAVLGIVGTVVAAKLTAPEQPKPPYVFGTKLTCTPTSNADLMTCPGTGSVGAQRYSCVWRLQPHEAKLKTENEAVFLARLDRTVGSRLCGCRWRSSPAGQGGATPQVWTQRTQVEKSEYCVLALPRENMDRIDVEVLLVSRTNPNDSNSVPPFESKVLHGEFEVPAW